MKRLVVVMLITLSLLCLATYEAILVANINDRLENDVNNLCDKFEDYIDNVSDLEEEVTSMRNLWEEKEPQLCLMFNHKDLSNVSDCFVRLLASVKNNDYDNATIEVNLLKEYIQKNRYTMGFNLQNIL